MSERQNHIPEGRGTALRVMSRRLSEVMRTALELAWDEGHRDVCNDCVCRPDANPYRVEYDRWDMQGEAEGY